MRKYTITSSTGQKATISLSDDIPPLTPEQVEAAAQPIFNALAGIEPGKVEIKLAHARWLVKNAEMLRVVAKHCGTLETADRILQDLMLTVAHAERPAHGG